LGFQFRGRVRSGEDLLSPARITGIQTCARRYAYDEGTGSVLVRFTPEGASCLGAPASSLASRSIPLEGLLSPARVATLRQRLLDATGAQGRVSVVESFLLELPFARDRVVSHALHAFGATGPEPTSVASIARALGLSERRLERRFLLRVGITPKRFATLRRFEHAVEIARSSGSLTRAAIDAGYYDQSHFIRDFRSFAGASPGEFFRASR
jgi:AraC-like DNA-binding protein